MLSLITYMVIGIVGAMITIVVGTAVGYFGAKKFGADGVFARILSYSNLLLWLSPVAGFFTSAATLAVADKSSNSAQKMRVMAAVCMIASVVNFIGGVILLQHHTI